MKLTGKLIVILSAVVFCFSVNSYAGKLDDFEKDATKKKDDKETKEKKDTSVCDEIFSAVAGFFVEIFVAGDGSSKKAGSSQTDAGVSPTSGPGDEDKEVREKGDPIRPFARVDASYQHMSSRLKAQDYFVELGYDPIALSGRFTHYMETDPDDSMDAIEVFLLYRMEFVKKFEVDLGIGDMLLDGESSHSGISFTVPVKFKPVDYVWLEFRPAIASINGNFMQDYDLSAHVGWRYASVKAGYRWYMSPNETLDGPYLGVSIYY
jgi:hypothetical protein